MSSDAVTEHHARAPRRVSCFVLVVSDSRKLETETSGRAIAHLLTEAGHEVLDRALVHDEPVEVVAAVNGAIARGAAVIITTGGTGIAKRDSTFEALSGRFEKTLPGFGELFRMLSFEQIGPAAMLSRATAGVLGGCALFMLPGSEDAVRLAMTRLVLPELGHIVQQLTKS
jgi:molybdenum cofactor biosynthesis protein B